MRTLLCCLLYALLTLQAASQERAFDYYVLSLSWSPNWCATQGNARGAAQCGPERDLGWSLHGLWPQYIDGYPSYCASDHRPPSRRDTARMAPIMGSEGLAWHQWKKHGSCTNLGGKEYFAASRAAYRAIPRPAAFRKLKGAITLPASVVEDAFLAANPLLRPSGVVVTCKAGHIQEVRICLTRDLEPRRCGHDVNRACTLNNALLEPIP